MELVFGGREEGAAVISDGVAIDVSETVTHEHITIEHCKKRPEEAT